MRIDFVFSLIMLIPWKSAFFIPPPPPDYHSWKKAPELRAAPQRRCLTTPAIPVFSSPSLSASRFLNASWHPANLRSHSPTIAVAADQPLTTEQLSKPRFSLDWQEHLKFRCRGSEGRCLRYSRFWTNVHVCRSLMSEHDDHVTGHTNSAATSLVVLLLFQDLLSMRWVPLLLIRIYPPLTPCFLSSFLSYTTLFPKMHPMTSEPGSVLTSGISTAPSSKPRQNVLYDRDSNPSPHSGASEAWWDVLYWAQCH